MGRRQPSRPTKTSTPDSESDSRTKSRSRAGWGTRTALCLLIAIGLAWIFWAPLFRGGGLIGGDFYPYYLPQKQYLSESLSAGRLPFWNDRTGIGYPTLGESQTGVLYPPNLIIFQLFDAQTAYNVSQIAHYVLAFVFTVAFARQLGLQFPGALLTGLVFVYGWFPARICLEWTILGGCWLATAAWSTAAFLRTGRSWGLIGVAGALAMSLLAGHYHMAFITLLMLPALCWVLGGVPTTEATQPDTNKTPKHGTLIRERFVPLLAAMLCGVMIAGVQLLPTWELKSRSARSAEDGDFNPATDTLPPLAISQLWQPWAWYRGGKSTDELLREADWLSVPSVTNQVEAQLYLGLLPLMLAVAGLAVPALRRRLPLQHPFGWLGVFVLFLFLATGWPTYWLADWPGFGYFRGTGRYSVVAALALAILAGAAWQAFTQWRDWNRLTGGVATGLILLATLVDLWMASRKFELPVGPFGGRQVFYSILIDQPPIQHLSQSPLKQYFDEYEAEHGPRARLLAPGANVPTLLGVSAVPAYLGLGPKLYDSDEFQFDLTAEDPEAVQATVARLKSFGVTHLLTEFPLDAAAWEVRSLGQVVDPVLNAALSRREPYWFYEFIESPGRISFENYPVENRILSFSVEPNIVRVEVEQVRGDRLILRDLAYPGWEVATEGFESTPYQTHFRSVALPMSEPGPIHRVIEWRYRPATLGLGGVVTGFGVLGLLVLVLFRRRSS